MTPMVESSANLRSVSMVVFPFKTEDPDVAAANLATAAGHRSVTRVLAVGATPDATFESLTTSAVRLTVELETPVEVVVQDRIGDRRPGKGDGMNTGLRRFLETDEDRLHFYDADITNFDASWIDGAEHAADRGYPIVRHYFPRASTDAMITWMITRPGFALTHPDSLLWKIRQPLGGELLIARRVAEGMADDPLVTARSDWGIDTVLTYATAASGHPIYEHYVADGKQHALYGSLDEIRQMVVECFEALADLARLPSPAPGEHIVEPETPATEAVATKVGYDVESTLALLTAPWAPDEVAATAELPDSISESLLANLARPTFAFMTAEAWRQTLESLLAKYRPETGWRGVLFRLWVARVLAYSTTDALGGHTRAMRTLEDMVASYAVAGH
jgi:mannosylglycerate synthase